MRLMAQQIWALPIGPGTVLYGKKKCRIPYQQIAAGHVLRQVKENIKKSPELSVGFSF